MNRIDNFNFTRGINRQDAVLDNRGAENGQSVVLCKSNSEVCAFQTILRDDFFTSSGIVGAIGVVTLQYRARTVVEDPNLSSDRRLLSNSSYLIAGQSTVKVDTLLLYQMDDSLNPCAFEHKFYEWWVEEETGAQIRYIGLLVLLALALGTWVLCCWLVPPCFFQRRRKTIEEKQNNVCVNIEVKKDTEHHKISEKGDDVIPEKYDIVFGERQRPMTRVFLKHVRTVARDNPSEEYGPSMYRSCKKPFEVSKFFTRDVEGKYKKLSREETIGMIGKAFVDAKIQVGEDETVQQSTVTGLTVMTAATTEVSGVDSRQNRLVRRIDSSGTLSELPGDRDIILGENNHLGTQRFLRTVNRIAAANPGTNYQASIYRSIKQSLEGSSFYSVDESGKYRKPKKTEICSLVGEVFTQAQSIQGCGHISIRSTIDVSQDSIDDLSSIGESLYRPWSDDNMSRKSTKSHRSQSGSSRASRRLRSDVSKSSRKTLKRSGSSGCIDAHSRSSKRELQSHGRSRSFSDLETHSAGASKRRGLSIIQGSSSSSETCESLTSSTSQNQTRKMK